MEFNNTSPTTPPPILTEENTLKKTIYQIRNMQKISNENINSLSSLTSEEKTELIKELISTYNYLSLFHKSHL